MRRTLQFICCSLLLALSASAQIQTIFVGDNGNVSLTKINSNFSYLNLNKAQVYSGSGAPGLIAASRLGDFYLRTDTYTTYQCYASTCNTVSTGNWQLIGGGGGGGCVPFGGVNQILVDSGAGNCLSSSVTIAGTTITASLDGNALSASTLQTSRLINGTPFNGSANITVPAAASTLTGTALSSGIITSSLTSFGNGPLLLNPTLSGATTIAITGSTQCLQVNTFGVISGTGITCAGSPAFSAITSGTNTTAAMLVGTGGSLSVTGSGTIAATSAAVLATARTINGTNFDGSTNITVSAAAATLTGNTLSSGVTISSLTSFGNSPTLAGSVVLSGITGSTQCLHVNSSGVISGTGSDCGAAGSAAFSSLTSGTNTTAVMVVGSGASLAPTGSGAITATIAPISGLTGAGTGVLTFLATPSSANLAAALTNETGSGAAVFATSPTLVTPILGTPSSGNLGNTTGFPVANLAGAGTGVLTSLAIAADSTGGFCVVGGSGCAGGSASLLSLNVSKTASTVLTINAGCSASTPCNFAIGNTAYRFTTSATATITAGSGTAYIYVSSAGVLTVASNVTVTCSGCTAVVGTSFPIGAVVGYTWTATSTVWDTSGGIDFRSQLSSFLVNGSTHTTSTATSGIPAIDVDIAANFAWTGRQDSSGSASSAPAKTGTSLPATCTVGDQYFKSDASAGSNLYGCTATNTWTVQAGGGGSSAFSALTSGTNTTAAMVVGTGGSIGVSGSGTNTATAAPVSGLTGAGTGVLTALAANVSGTGAICLASGSACGSGSSPAFSALTSATNTTAAMVVGTGASMAVSGSGTIAATSAPVAGLTGAGTGVLTALAANVSGTGAICLASGSACAGSGSPGGSDTQCQYNNSGSFGGNAGCTTNGTVYTLTNPTLSGQVTSPQGTLTGSSVPAYTHTVTWNNAATVFIDNLVDITDTASDSASNFVVLRRNGTPVFSISKTGEVGANGSILAPIIIAPGGLFRLTDGIGGAVDMTGPASGVLQITNAIGGFDRIQLGGDTTSFPAIHRNGTTIETKLADNSAYAQSTALKTQVKPTTVGALGTCSGTEEGTMWGVTDALTPVALSTVSAGGSVHVPVYCNGTNWIVF